MRGLESSDTTTESTTFSSVFLISGFMVWAAASALTTTNLGLLREEKVELLVVLNFPYDTKPTLAIVPTTIEAIGIWIGLSLVWSTDGLGNIGTGWNERCNLCIRRGLNCVLVATGLTCGRHAPPPGYTNWTEPPHATSYMYGTVFICH